MKKKSLVITAATIALIVLAATLALLALGAGSHQTCGDADPAQLRQAADPDYAANLQKLARCGS